MNVWVALVAAVLLGVERACYAWIARAPNAFRAWSARPAVAWLGEPVAVVRTLFYAFKLLQAAVFLGWCYVHGHGSLAPTARDLSVLVAAGGAIAVGQALNWSVFYRLGWVGAFFGDRLGYDVPWSREFPFSLLSHPQYVGTVLTIWGFFALMRFPHADWLVLPVLETLYYLAGGLLEARRRTPRWT
jgi:methylene-fatty-acyl-phospholipid synthase